MVPKLALKRLTASDLTIFKWHLENFPAGKQKAINLNADVFIKQLYPSVPVIIEEKQGTIPLDLYIYGPGLASEYNIQRKIQKRGSYKNYRLNGEFITDPEDNPDRFHPLQPSDFVIFEFIGDLEPNSARAVFIAQNLAVDAYLHQALKTHIGSKSMVVLFPKDLEGMIKSVKLPIHHPANLLVLEASLEDVALGGTEGLKTLRSGPFKGRVSRQTLEQARKNAQKIGRLGEELTFNYLESIKRKGLIRGFQWTADDNAISPYDFSIQELDGTTTLIDVKSTKGNFTNRVHVSYNELLQMQDSDQYDLYRVFDITDDSAQLRVAKNLKTFAERIIKVLQELPSGIKSDGISFDPSELTFGNIQQITFQESEE